MRKSKFSEAQIVEIPKDAESGVPVAELLRKHGVSKATFFTLRRKYAGATVAAIKRLRKLEILRGHPRPAIIGHLKTGHLLIVSAETLTATRSHVFVSRCPGSANWVGRRWIRPCRFVA